MMICNGETINKLTYFMSDPEWFYYENDDADTFPILTDKAPPKAVESYKYAKAVYEEEIREGLYN